MAAEQGVECRRCCTRRHVFALLPSIFLSPPLSFSLSCYFFHLISPFHLPSRDEIVLISSRVERILFLTIVCNQLALFDTERKSKTGNSNYNFSRDPRSSYGYGKRDYTHTTREGAFLRVIGVVAAREKFFNHVCPIVDITLVTVSQD